MGVCGEVGDGLRWGWTVNSEVDLEGLKKGFVEAIWMGLKRQLVLYLDGLSTSIWSSIWMGSIWMGSHRQFGCNVNVELYLGARNVNLELYLDGLATSIRSFILMGLRR